MTQILQSFPLIKEQTYLDTPAIGLISKEVKTFKQKQAEELWKKGSGYMAKYGGMNDEVREKLAAVFNADPQYVALFPAFSYGFNLLLEALKPNQKVLLLKNDYPSVNKTVEARDFQVTYAEINENLEKNIQEQFKKDRPDVFVFSVVQYLNGIQLKTAFIKQLKHQYPKTLFIADGTQYLGAGKFDFKNSGIDILGASAYKWIGAGLGNSFLLFNPKIAHKLTPKNIGFGSVIGKYKEVGNTLIGKFEGNHLDVANIGSIKTALTVQEKFGMDFIEEKVQSLGKKAKEVLSEMNFIEESVINRQHHSSIFNLKGGEALFKKLQHHNIACSQRGEGIRIAFHYYNTKDDLEKLIEVLQ